MTKEQIRKDSQEPPKVKNPSSEKVSKGKSLGINRKKFSAIVSNRLAMNPPNPSLSEKSEKQDDLVFSGNDKVDSEDEVWFREFVTKRLEIDAPTPDPVKENINSSVIPVSPGTNSNESIGFSDPPVSDNLASFDKNISNLFNPINSKTEKSNNIENWDHSATPSPNIEQKSIDNKESEISGKKINRNSDNKTDRLELSSKEDGDNKDDLINQAVSDKKNGKEQVQYSSPPLKRNDNTGFVFPKNVQTPKVNGDSKITVNSPFHEAGENGKGEAASTELVSGLETKSNLSIDKKDSHTISEKEESPAAPEVKLKRKTSWVLISILLVTVVVVGAWAMRDFTFGQYSKSETEEAYSKSTPTNLPVVIYPNDIVSEEIKSTPIALRPTVTPKTTPNPMDYDRSVLTQIQKDRLYKASLAYLADDEEDAIYIARSLDYVPNAGHPASMCGPLAVGILRDAMLIDRYVDLESFWLLNPRDDYTVRAILEKYFPREHYQWYQTSTPINYYDFKSYPLYTGDFLYLFAGRRGTFEHMIVVTRVDDAGRAYSVSAQEDSNGYSIKEVMLYDPNSPGEGYFYEITDNANTEFGLTGLGGFWMWRRLTPIPAINLDDLAFGEKLDTILDKAGGDWHVYIKEIDDRVIYSREAAEIIHPASVIKVPLAIQFFQALDYQEEDDIIEFLSERGTGGRTYMQLLRAMLVDSEEDASDILEDWVDDRVIVEDIFAKWGTLETTFYPRRTTAEEISKIFEGLYQSLWLTPDERDIILDLLAEYTSGDDSRLGVIWEKLPEDYSFFNKRGSIVHGRVVVADVAIIEAGDKAYVVALFGYLGLEDNAPTYDDLEATIEEAALWIWEYINQQ